MPLEVLSLFCILFEIIMSPSSLLQLLVLHAVIAIVYSQCCFNSCSGKGRCVVVGGGCICQCFQGYTGADCSKSMRLVQILSAITKDINAWTLGTCPRGKAWAGPAAGIDRAHLPSVCSQQGTCDETTGVCQCNPGFTGAACDRCTLWLVCMVLEMLA